MVTIDVPGEKMNTLRDSFADESARNVLKQGKKDDVFSVWCLSVVKSDNFIAGADIKMLDNAHTREDALRDIRNVSAGIF